MLQCKTKWKKEKLGDLILFLRNGISNEQVDIYTDFPVTRIETIADGKIDYNRAGHVEKAPEDYRIQQGDILVSNINSQKHIGKVAIKDDDKVLYHGMNLLLMRPNEIIDSKFLFYVLNYNKQYFERIASPAVNQSSINQTDMQKMEFIIPKDKVEQTKIADILSTCDEVIEKTEETIEKYKQIKAGMMQDLFTRGLGENGKLRPTYTQAPDLYKYSKELDRHIPKEWDVKTFKDICYVNQGLQIAISNRHKRNGVNRYLYITIQYLNTLKNPEYIENPQQSVICSKEDILMTRTGNTGFVVTGVEGVFHNNFFKINYDKESLDKDYMIYYLNQEEIQKMILDKAGLTTIPDLSHGDFYSLPILIFDKSEQTKISNTLLTIDKKIDIEEQYLNKYKQIKQGLMKRLLTPPADAEIVEE